MSHTLQHKIKTLRSILKKYKKCIKTKKCIECFIENERIIIRTKRKGDNYYKTTSSIPISEIDIIISRYRSLLYLEKNKIKGLSEAINEIEYIDEIKEIMK